jgi:ribosomal protein S18 acetylase RimI-like enzyme
LTCIYIRFNQKTSIAALTYDDSHDLHQRQSPLHPAGFAGYIAFGAMNTQVAALALSHFDGLRAALDTVAREKRFLAFTEAPPASETHAFYQNILVNDHSHFVALVNGKVAGWCDVLPTHGQARRHVGILGIGLVPQARRRGIGRLLIQAALSKARSKGLLRIELTVRVDNLNAKVLYESVGFKTEGTCAQALLIDGEFHDTYAMALLQ